MTQTPPKAAPPPRRRKPGRRRSRQKGVSPFVIMGAVGLIVIIAIAAYSIWRGSAGLPTYGDIPQDRNTLGYPDATVQIVEFGDFQ